ncbi:MAG: rhodanese-like domain-containing protein [Reichenbachiella sp.]
MTKSYLFISALLITLGLMALMLPNDGSSSRLISEEEALQEMKMKTYYFSADQLSDLLINHDPEILIIDVRSKGDYEKASIPNSINIPMDSLFTDNWIGYIDQTLKKNVFYADNDDVTAKVWLETRMKGFGNNYMLEGGYDSWNANILNPEPPNATEDKAAFALYQQRVGARTYFTGEKAEQKQTKIILKPIKRKKKKMVAGGCS